jgi:hypothetical protein
VEVPGLAGVPAGRNTTPTSPEVLEARPGQDDGQDDWENEGGRLNQEDTGQPQRPQSASGSRNARTRLGENSAGRGAPDSGGTEPTMPNNVELIMRFHPVGGDDVSVMSRDFGGEKEALEAIAGAVDQRRSLVLTQARYNREANESGMVINLANVVSVRVSNKDSAATGQYL